MGLLRYYNPTTLQYEAIPFNSYSITSTGIEYSTTEQVIAAWTDGKPIYRVVSSTTPADAETIIRNESVGSLKIFEYTKSTDVPNSFDANMISVSVLDDVATDNEADSCLV